MKRIQKIKVWERDNYTCYICWKDLSEYKDANILNSPLTVDHIIPKSRGGTSDKSNLRTCCSDCNKRMGRRDEFLIY